jgi:hypothetical protein
MLKLLLVSGFIALLLAGCGGGGNSPLPSTSYATNSIYAYMKAVQDEGGNVTTTVQLRDGAASTAKYLYLAAGDVLYTSLDIPPQQYMSFNGNLFGNSLTLSQRLKVAAVRDLFVNYFLFTQVVTGKPEYFSDDTPGAGTSPLHAYVDFERAGNVLTGPSSVDLPPAYQILAPASDATVSRAAAPITLSWTNDIAGVCVDGNRYALNYYIGTDAGSATLTGANYFPTTGTIPTGNCHVAFMLQRVRTGSGSPKFAFASFEGVQQRTVQFTSTP